MKHLAAAFTPARTVARLIVAGGLFILAPVVARGQAAGTLWNSLEEAQSQAVTASHRLAEARARAATTESLIAVRAAADRPLVTLVGGDTRTNHVVEFVIPIATGVPRVLYPDAPDTYRTRVDGQWSIYSGGRTDALERAARADASAASADVAAA